MSNYCKRLNMHRHRHESQLHFFLRTAAYGWAGEILVGVGAGVILAALFAAAL